jgi:hypothetical protein
MRRRLSGHVKAFLKCFVAIVVASSAVVLAISNFESAYKQSSKWIVWITHFARGTGHEYAVPIAVAVCVIGAGFLSSHIHLRHHIPGAKNRLLGGGVVSFALALLLAIDAHNGRPHMSKGQDDEPRQVKVARVSTQSVTGGEETTVPRVAGESTMVSRVAGKSGAGKPVPVSDDHNTDEPRAPEAELASYTPEDSEPAMREETGGPEEGGSEESVPEENEGTGTTEPDVQYNNTSTTTSSSSTGTSTASASGTASVAVYSPSSSNSSGYEATSEEASSTPSEPQTTETTSEEGSIEGGCPEE